MKTKEKTENKKAKVKVKTEKNRKVKVKTENKKSKVRVKAKTEKNRKVKVKTETLSNSNTVNIDKIDSILEDNKLAISLKKKYKNELNKMFDIKNDNTVKENTGKVGGKINKPYSTLTNDGIHNSDNNPATAPHTPFVEPPLQEDPGRQHRLGQVPENFRQMSATNAAVVTDEVLNNAQLGDIFDGWFDRDSGTV